MFCILKHNNKKVIRKRMRKDEPCKHETSHMREKTEYFIILSSNPPGICDNSKFVCT